MFTCGFTKYLILFIRFSFDAWEFYVIPDRRIGFHEDDDDKCRMNSLLVAPPRVFHIWSLNSFQGCYYQCESKICYVNVWIVRVTLWRLSGKFYCNWFMCFFFFFFVSCIHSPLYIGMKWAFSIRLKFFLFHLYNYVNTISMLNS